MSEFYGIGITAQSCLKKKAKKSGFNTIFIVLLLDLIFLSVWKQYLLAAEGLCKLFC